MVMVMRRITTDSGWWFNVTEAALASPNKNETSSWCRATDQKQCAVCQQRPKKEPNHSCDIDVSTFLCFWPIDSPMIALWKECGVPSKTNWTWNLWTGNRTMQQDHYKNKHRSWHRFQGVLSACLGRTFGRPKVQSVPHDTTNENATMLSSICSKCL